MVFLQGCKMRCKYCHNPETWNLNGGEEYSPRRLFDKVWKYRAYWGKNLDKGGVTVSGGEPLLQIDFVIEFFKILKSKGVHTAIDTSGQPYTDDSAFLEKFDELLKYTDLVLLDLKHSDSIAHKDLTGFANDNILKMAKHLSDKKTPVWIRHVLVPGITDGEEHLKNLKAFINTLENVEKVEILPYHTLGLFKWENLGMKYQLDDVKSPTADEIARAKQILEI